VGIAIVVVAVVVVLFVVMKWADRRDRAKGHVNRGSRDLKNAIRAGKEHKIQTQLRYRPRRPPKRK
jgi:FtsZ-interacting cell division protein ZipA